MDSPNESPTLDWSGAPPGTASFAITLTDVSFGQPHWVIWNIPGEQSQLPANVAKDTATPAIPAGSQQASATFAPQVGYFGPQAPCNVYQFEIFALSLATFESSQPELAAVVRSELQALGDAVLGQATLNGRTNYMMMCE
jgi:Raf kinase inhibitor-like YbhB/YbcL family protein